MKKISALLLIVIMLFTLTACGESDPNKGNSSTATAQEQSEEKTTNRLDALKEQQNEQNSQVDAKEAESKKAEQERESRNQEKRNSITTNTKLLDDLTKSAWGYLTDGEYHLIFYMSFHDDGTVYFADFYDFKGGNLITGIPDTISGDVVYGINSGEYAIDEDNSEIVVFHHEWDSTNHEVDMDSKIRESHILYSYEGDKLKLEGDQGEGFYHLFYGEYLVEYINDDSFVDFFDEVMLNNNKKRLSVASFYQNHPNFIREDRSR